MRQPERGAMQGDERGVSELIGAVIIVGLVLTGSLLVVYFGTNTINEAQQGQSDESTEIGIQEVDSRLSTLATSSATTVANFEIGSNIEGDASLAENEGYVHLTVNERSACSVQESLDSVRVERDDGQIVAYEAGGTWIKSPDGGAIYNTAPDIFYRNGTIDIALLNLTGKVREGNNQAVVDVNTSRRDTKNAVNTLLQDECVRPDNVTLRVQSDFYRGWGNYLEGETGLERVTSTPSGDDSYLMVDDATQTVTVYLNQSSLPRRTNDEINNVVNVTGADYMHDVTVSDDGIRIDKGVNNTYTVYSEPISERPEIGTVRRVAQADNVTRPPLDVVFVVDESGSMAWSAAGDSKAKYEAVRDAMRDFTTYLDSNMDRVGLVGYNQYHTEFVVDNGGVSYYLDGEYREINEGSNRGAIYRTNSRMLTRDFVEFNSSTVTETEAVGGTYSGGGMKKAAGMLDLQSNETRNRTIVMLTDGKNTGADTWYIGKDSYTGSNSATIELAKRMNQTGMTTYTIGFAEDDDRVNEDFLRDTADAGGGEYYFATDSEELEDVFSSIAERVSSTEQVGHYGVTTNLSTDETAHPPQITGDVSRIATATADGKEWLNVNDPTAPSAFSHAFAVSGGDMVDFTATQYSCDKWVGTGQTKMINGSSIPVTRCAEMNTTSPTVVDSDNVTVFTNDDSAVFNDFLDNTSSAEWQTNLSEALDDYGGLYNESSNELTLKSNEVLVLYDFPDGKHTDNRMLMLYNVGLSEEEARLTGVIDIDIDNVEVAD
ncbi:vWA domain-containing protein [Halapricum hydrolyticum]|uniref:VWA domain-containing protein n=1 Tax=Halapricum hydrolyticum TaxID=2979991 RepID=A0AAE3I8Q3_9EURY|nr:vWA domain-containing protein [Halapricum hydrolyticum]MCU4716595.1 VWA domain-containing protein [Halapricum hydrolyticum]MCU4725800.1 VWA domain-containing protein [Halapricum hydrolyticum]